MRRANWLGVAGIIASCGLLTEGGLAAFGKDEVPNVTPNVQVLLEGHPGGVTAITFNGKGTEIATGAGNGIVRIWNPRSGGAPLHKLEDCKGVSISGLSFSPDGNILAACGKGKAGLWSVLDVKLGGKSETGAPYSKSSKAEPKVDLKHFNWVSFPTTDSEANYSDVAVTGDGKEVYFSRRHQGFNYPGRVFRYDKARDATEERPGPKHLDPRSVASISDPESGVAAVYASIGDKQHEAAVLLYGFGEPKTITRGVPPLTNGTNPRITYSTDGRWLAAYCGTLAVWQVPGSHIIHGEPGTLDNVYAAAIGPGNLLATVAAPDEYRDAKVYLWKLGIQVKNYGMFGTHWTKHLVEVKKVATYQTSLRDVSCLAFSPTGRILAVGGFTDGVVQLWKIE